jgi:hypothetical protein
LKHIIRLLLPPIFLEAIAKIRSYLTPARPEWEVMPNTDAVWTAHPGWAHRSIAETERAKWPAFLASIEGTRPFGWPHEALAGTPIDVGAHNMIVTFGYVLGRAAVRKRRISVLDWGGGIGHYYLYSRRLQPELSLDYVVKDLPSLCAVGHSLLPEPTFTSDDSQALSRNYDLVLASSSLQYNRNFYDVLGRLCDVAAGWLMVTRSPLSSMAMILSWCNGPTRMLLDRIRGLGREPEALRRFCAVARACTRPRIHAGGTATRAQCAGAMSFLRISVPPIA